jgi:Methyltransferase FkbM domain
VRKATRLGNYSVKQNFGSFSLREGPQGDLVPLITLDSLNLPACHLIDAEGMESDVIAGAEQTIRRCRPMLYLENDREEKSAGLIRQLLGLEYRLYWHLPRLFNPGNYFASTENVFSAFFSANMLGIPASMCQEVAGLREITNPHDRWQIASA